MFICSLVLLLNILLPILCSLTSKTNLGHRRPHGFQNSAAWTAQERGMILLFLSFCVFSYGKGKWCEVCVPWAMESSSMICFLAACWGVISFGKKIPSKSICLYFSSFSLASRCAKPLSSLVKCFLVKYQNSTCLFFLLENIGSVCIFLVFPLHRSYKALVWLQNLLCWRGGIPFELMVKK